MFKWLVRNLVEMVATWLVTILNVAAFVAWFQEILRQEKELARLGAMNGEMTTISPEEWDQLTSGSVEGEPAIRGKHAKR
jgi:hypothetical protein